MTLATRTASMVTRVHGRLSRAVKVVLRDKTTLAGSTGARTHTTGDVTTTATLQPETGSEDLGSTIVARSRVYRVPVSAFTGSQPDRDDLLYDPTTSSTPWRIVAVRPSADRQVYDLECERGG